MADDLGDHPLIQHHLTILRDVNTSASEYRRACSAVTQVLMTEAAKVLTIEQQEVMTPLEKMVGGRLSGEVVLVPVLRAGLGMLPEAMAMIPGSSVGYIGLERDEATAVASCYYAKMPELESASHIFVLDPMLATGGSAINCVDQLKERGATHITMVCILAAPEGIDNLRAAHPDVDLIIGKIDRQLNDHKYILPGLGDFGDRLFNTVSEEDTGNSFPAAPNIEF